jgi:hypothetical protein
MDQYRIVVGKAECERAERKNIADLQRMGPQAKDAAFGTGKGALPAILLALGRCHNGIGPVAGQFAFVTEGRPENGQRTAIAQRQLLGHHIAGHQQHLLAPPAQIDAGHLQAQPSPREKIKQANRTKEGNPDRVGRQQLARQCHGQQTKRPAHGQPEGGVGGNGQETKHRWV